MKDLSDAALGEIVGSLLEVEETGALGSDRARCLVEMAEKAAGELETVGCTLTAMVDGRVVRCGRCTPGHSGNCSFRSPAQASGRESSAEDDLGSLDDLLEWVPDPGPIRDEILGLLAKLPQVEELDRVAWLVGKLATLVDVPAGNEKP